MLQEFPLDKVLTDFCFEEDEVYGIVSGDLKDAMPFFVERKKWGLSQFEKSDDALRFEPQLHFKNYASAIVLMKRYPLFEVTKKAGEGQVASFAVGEDYHVKLIKRLEILGQYIGGVIPSFTYLAGTDTLPLLDRQLAYKTGLVFYGKHHQAIYPQWGANFSVGYLLTNQVWSAGFKPQKSLCGSCRKCIEACPTFALIEGGFKPDLCLSSITQQKGVLTSWQQAHMQTYLYGCDACLLACPFSRDIQASSPQCTEDLDFLIQASNNALKRHFNKSAIAWRGPSVIRRNAQCIRDHQKNQLK